MKPWHEDMSCEEIYCVEAGEWHLAFDGSSAHQGGGTGVVPYDPKGTSVSMTFKPGSPSLIENCI